MFKKSLIAVAALSALAGSAMAADVQIYGRIDTGFRYQNVDYDVVGVDDDSSFGMVSGNYSGSRVGIKGSEDLGNGLTVGFVLENGFEGDDGSFDSNEELFGREALLYLEGDFGKVGFGRMGILNSTAGSFAIGNFTPWGTGWGSVGDQSLIFGASIGSRWDNMISYRSPEFAGFQVHAQYSFGANTYDDEDDPTITYEEGKTTTDRYYAIGATYNVGGLNLIGIVDSVNEKHVTGDDPDDTLRVTIGGSYDFGVVKPYLSAAYFKDAAMKTWMDSFASGKTAYIESYLKGDWDGYGVILGASAPLVGGTAHMTIGYMDAEEQNKAVNNIGADLTRYTFAVGYEYPLSKRTKVYADAGYFKDEFDWGEGGGDSVEPEGYQAAVGMIHYF
jgi:predicted porin